MVTGTVVERTDAATYSYLRLETSSGEIWAAVPQTDIAVGSVVGIENSSWMHGFESKALGRSFDRILFGTLSGEATEPGSGGLPAGHVAVDGQPAAARPASDGGAGIQIAKAEGPDGRTIAELYAQRESLAGASVVVQGQVVKFTPAVMGRNWLHLQYGSGSPADQNHDLTVTTDAEVNIGDTVLIRGQVEIDRDFGAGYTYSLVIEQAVVSPATPNAG